MENAVYKTDRQDELVLSRRFQAKQETHLGQIHQKAVDKPEQELLQQFPSLLHFDHVGLLGHVVWKRSRTRSEPVAVCDGKVLEKRVERDSLVATHSQVCADI